MGGILPHVSRFLDPDSRFAPSFLAAMDEFLAEG
jgi:hypothetical protein